MHEAFKHSLVIFCDSDNNFVRDLCKSGFSHVSLYFKTSETWWLSINPTFTGCEFYFLETKQLNDFMKSKSSSISVLSSNSFVHNTCTKTPAVIGPRTCAGLVSYLLGLKSLHIWPYGLYRKLLSTDDWRKIDGL